ELPEPLVQHSQPCGLAVHEDQQRIFLCWIEIARLDHPAVQCDPFANIEAKEFRRSGNQRLNLGSQRRVFFENARLLVVGKTDEIGCRWLIKGRSGMKGPAAMRRDLI